MMEKERLNETAVCDILTNAINHYGKENQIAKAIEEMAELTVALLHNLRKNNTHNICEEIADVQIMLYQLGMIFDKEGMAIVTHMETKLNRLSQRISLREMGL